jgi:hypothetical protein
MPSSTNSPLYPDDKGLGGNGGGGDYSLRGGGGNGGVGRPGAHLEAQDGVDNTGGGGGGGRAYSGAGGSGGSGVVILKLHNGRPS